MTMAIVKWGDDEVAAKAEDAHRKLLGMVRSYIENELDAGRLDAATITRQDGKVEKVLLVAVVLGGAVVVYPVTEA